MLFGTFPGVTVADSGCSASQKCEKNSCKEQELLQEQSEIKILSGFCWEKERLDLSTLQTPARNRRGKLQARTGEGIPSLHTNLKNIWCFAQNVQFSTLDSWCASQFFTKVNKIEIRVHLNLCPRQVG